jgi:uncharacterized OB-fold protein
MTPVVTELSEPFWTGLAEGELRIFHCEDCGYYIHPPVPVCRRCHSANVGPAEVRGTGTVTSFTTNHHPWTQEGGEPYTFVVVDLDEQEGLRLTSNLVDCDARDVRIGMRVQTVFERQEGVSYPCFRPLASSAHC